jgi:transposase
MINVPDRRETIELINEARRKGARQESCCRIVGISARTYQRWTRDGEVNADPRPISKRPPPANKLSEAEKDCILQICHKSEYASLPPGQIVPRLADKGEYIASESSFYRVLHQADEQHHRGRSQKPNKRVAPRGYCATGVNQVWTWDITWLPAGVRGMFFYLYMIACRRICSQSRSLRRLSVESPGAPF